MSKFFTILYTFRNRDIYRVRLSLRSLQQQKDSNFMVVFVDYGSDPDYGIAVKKVVDDFDFVTYHYVAHPGLLWNKSKAINYGIYKATTPYVFLADVDVIFHHSFSAVMQQLATPVGFYLFTIGYLPKEINTKEAQKLSFEQRKPTHTGDTFGIGLFPLEALQRVEGLDTFFHFYGSEDADLNARLQQAGYVLKYHKPLLIQHLWHPRYPAKRDTQLTVQPRLSNVQRINQRHLQWHQEIKAILPCGKGIFGNCYVKEDQLILEKPTKTYQLFNISAHVIHFLEVVLPALQGEVVHFVCKEDSYSHSLKYQVKQFLGKHTQPYLSMKQVNDLVLQQIVFYYRNCNYSYAVSQDLKEICFTVDLSKQLSNV